MIPNIETGKSFRGAQLYYLHDKREAKGQLRLSDERVIWTDRATPRMTLLSTRSPR